MPKDKDLKRLIRVRMDKTGESYTAARLQVLKKGTPLPENHVELAGVRDETVKAKTGHTWKEWTRLLDDVDAVAMSHPEIARYVVDNFDIGSWWAQSVTVGYERIRGLREVGQRRTTGEYEANKSKTFPVPIASLFEAFIDEANRHEWMRAQPEITTVRQNRSLRMIWEDGTAVDAWFTSKGDAKSSVQIQHRKLKSAAELQARKDFWQERFKALGDLLTL